MKIRATKSFTGKVTMMQDEVRNVREEIAIDLVSSGYAVEIGNDAAVQPEGGDADDSGNEATTKTGKKAK